MLHDAPSQSRRVEREEKKLKEAEDIYNYTAHARELLEAGANERDFEQIKEKLRAISTLTDSRCYASEEFAEAARVSNSLLVEACISELEEMECLIHGAMEDIAEALTEPKPVVDRGHTPTEEELRDIYREKHTNVSDKDYNADNQDLLDMLIPVVRATKEGHDIHTMTVGENGTLVVSRYNRNPVTLASLPLKEKNGLSFVREVVEAILQM